MRAERRTRAFGVVLAAVCLLSGGLAALDWASPPDLVRFEDRSRIVLDRTGAPLRAFMSRDQKWRLLTRPEDVDPLYLAMLAAYEDKRFHRHVGVDPLALGRAVGQAVRSGRVVSGASTLTMQAARLLEPRRRGLWAKAAEMWRALQLEARRDKDDVLAVYLTLAPFGGAVEGVRAAALKLFGREPRLLTPAEAALLVALPQSPTARRPDRHPAAARAARGRVLARAEDAGLLTPAEAAAAAAAPLPSAYRPLPFLAPHLAEELAGRADVAGAVATSLDADLQAAVERRVAVVRADFPAPVTAAAIVVDVETAEVRALVGAPDYFDGKRAGMLDMTRALRSPGSALKPFIYGLAFDRLIAAPGTLIVDRPFNDAGYAPTNFDGRYAGEVTVAEALVRSLNVPAVKVLRRLGPARFDAALATAGIDLAYDREQGDPGLALALGGVGVDLRALARAYLAIAGDGRAPARLAFEAGASTVWRPVFDEGAARDVLAILSDAPPPPGHGGSKGVAFKTGTSYGYRDALAVGVAGGHVIATWVGRPDGASCFGCVGRAAAAPILFDIAQLLPGSTRVAPARIRRAPPAPLRHFDNPSAVDSGGRAVGIDFPADGAALRLGRSGALPLVASGGRGPYRWLVDGAPVGQSDGGAALPWRPDGPGFHRVVVVDRRGVTADARISVAGFGARYRANR